MKTVTFKFEIDQKVKVTKLGITGIVSMCSINDAGNTYYVDTENGSSWYPERLLTDAEGGEE
jgi:hypothetical protein